MPTPISNDPATYNSSTEAPFVLGQEVEWAGKRYIWVRVANGAGENNLADGDVVSWAYTSAGGSTPGYYVTNALSGTANTSGIAGNPCAGVAVGTVTKNNYGFVLTRGLHTNVKGAGTVNVGYRQRIGATAASGSDAAALTDSTFGDAASTISGSRYSVYVRVG